MSNHDRSNHDRRIMSENPGVYMAMKSAVIFILFLVFFSLALETTSGFFCPRGTGSSFEKFEFARYLPPVNCSLRERRGFDRSSCETGTNMSRVWQKILFPRFAKCLGHH